MRKFIFLSILLISSLSFGQMPSQGKADPIKSTRGYGFGTVFMHTNIGSFRIMGTQDFQSAKRIRAEGRVEVVFTGTVLINDLKGKVITSGSIRKEYDKHGRTAYFGKGKLIIEGEFWAVQFFGTKMDARWTGWGIARMYGEFDENLETGFYWFDNAPKKTYWSPFGSTISLPHPLPAGTGLKPTERKPGGGKP